MILIIIHLELSLPPGRDQLLFASRSSLLQELCVKISIGSSDSHEQSFFFLFFFIVLNIIA